MKQIKKWLIVAILGIAMTSCVDEILFGDAFLEKAPGGDVTQEIVFDNAEYARQFLTGIYALQYYGLPYHTENADKFPYPYSGWFGKWENLSDCWHTTWPGQGVTDNYYGGTHSAGYGRRKEKMDYTRQNLWQAIRSGWIFLENIDRVPDMDAAEKEILKAEAKCLIAARYWDMFRHYGGLPLVRGTFSGADATYEMPRATVEETVKYMVDLFDDAIKVLPWQVAVPANETGRWTKAGAMAVKTSILLFAASPLFNSAQPYMDGDAATNLNVWYGSYKPELWDDCLKACEEFFEAWRANGQFELVQANGTRPEDYRLAFRKAYFTLTSSEVLHSTRVTTYDSFGGSTYVWHSWQRSNDRIAYGPTQEYVEMFPWADGTPFDWAKAESDGSLQEMFIERTADPSAGVALTRDPRLYETVIVNGMPTTLDWSTGNMAGNPYETWSEGHAVANGLPGGKPRRVGYYTGYALMKYYLEDDALRQDCHWSYIRLPEVMFNYAEALCQSTTRRNLGMAIDLVDDIRARVGLKGLVESNPNKDLTGNSEALLQEILRERACELGMEDVRFFDMIRYKMKDRFEAQLHRLEITRNDGKTGQWFGSDKDAGVPWPEFTYKRALIDKLPRAWWGDFDPKWYLSPFPLNEINKGYGLVQNPGW